jgi:hypothetical protein
MRHLIYILLPFFCFNLYAGSIIISSTQPTIDQKDIAHFTGADSSDLIWTDRPNIGQTFTMGSKGGTLNSFSFKASGGGLATKTYSFRIGSVSGSNFTTISIDSASHAVDLTTDDFITFIFDNPIELSENTVYGVDIEMTGSTTGWATGIPSMRRVNSNVYSDGKRYTRVDGDPSTISLDNNRDYIFHVDIDSLPPKGTVFYFR